MQDYNHQCSLQILKLTSCLKVILFCVKTAFTSCNSTHLEPESLLSSSTYRNNRDTCRSPFDKLWLSGCRGPVPALLWIFLRKRMMKSPLHRLSRATKKKTYLFSKIPNYERQNLAGRCALLSLSWLLFARVYLPADIHDVTEIHFTAVMTSTPNPVTEQHSALLCRWSADCKVAY